MTMTSRTSKFSVRAAIRPNAYNYARTPRKPNWSEVECEYLLQEIQKNLTVIRSRKPDRPGSRQSRKADMWNKMCVGLHVKRPTVMRSVRDLKDKWKKLQFMAKQHVARVRSSATAIHNQDGQVIIPKLVYRVLEAKGQDPQKLGLCAGICDITPQSTNAVLNLEGNFSTTDMAEQESTSVSLSSDPNGDSAAIKEEITDVDQMYPDDPPVEPDFTLKIQSAVSLAPEYNQTDRDTANQLPGTSNTSRGSTQTVPVSLERADTISQANISATSFSISSRLLPRKSMKMGTLSGRSFQPHRRAGRLLQARSRPHASFSRHIQNPAHRACSQGLQNTDPSLQLHPEVMEDSTPVSSELSTTFTPCLDQLQTSFQLGNDQQITSSSCPSSVPGQAHDAPTTFHNVVEEPSILSSGPNHRRLCPKGLLGHICDDEVVELQREVLREERDKIRLEKEILEMHREKLKLELIVLRQKVNGIR